MRFLRVMVLVAFLIPLLPARSAWACSCIMPGAPLDELTNADAVFAGEILDVQPLGADPQNGPRVVTVEVSDVWKGDVTAMQQLTTEGSSAACGYEFQVGQRYIVYAFNGEQGLSTNLCTRTAMFPEADVDVQELGDATSPLPVAEGEDFGPAPTEAPTGAQNAGGGNGGLIAIALLAAVVAGVAVAGGLVMRSRP